VRKGRGEFLAQFRSLATPEMQRLLPDPADRATFERCKLDLNEREAHSEAYTLHRDLIRLRKHDPVFSKSRAGSFDGAMLGSEAFLIRWFDDEKGDRLLIVNLGADLHLSIAPEPLLAPPERRRWDILWSSESPKYGGAGTAALETEDGWHIPGHSAVLLVPEPETQIRMIDNDG
jgi:maltooligosyltrehalose trehalohydrolase